MRIRTFKNEAIFTEELSAAVWKSCNRNTINSLIKALSTDLKNFKVGGLVFYSDLVRELRTIKAPKEEEYVSLHWLSR